MFTPRFCPHRDCSYHRKEEKRPDWYRPWGSYQTRTFGRVLRFRCRSCGRTFSVQTFSLDYYAKKKVDYSRVFDQIITAGGVRDIARQEGISTGVVKNRTARLAHQAMAVLQSLLNELTLEEDLCADGFESFTVSQYFPNNINILVGKESQMVYHANYVTIRRKGRMTEEQKKRRKVLEKIWRAPRRGIQSGFEQLMLCIEDLLPSSGMNRIRLYTDEKKEYPRAVSAVEQQLSRPGKPGYSRPLRHIQISSRKARTLSNHLFPVNYLDRQIRKDGANHTRETVQFARNVSDCMNRLMIYFLHHNCLKPYRIKLQRQDPRTHAEVAGVRLEIIRRELETLYSERRFLSHLVETAEYRNSLNSCIQIWMRQLKTPLKGRKEYCPAYYAS